MPASSAAPRVSRRPPDSDFYQQRLKAWQPILTPFWVIVTFLLIGVPFVILGYFLKRASDNVVEYSVQYDGPGTDTTAHPNCSPGTGPCVITFNVAEKMTAPVFVYYQLDNFYQNHRRYVKSRSDPQLAGTIFDSSSQVADCDPLRTDASGKVLQPCGLIANSYFNDTIALTSSTPGTYSLDESNIAWKSDQENKFKEPSPAEQAAHASTVNFNALPVNVTNEHFIVWMRVAALPNFRKLYGRINNDIAAGTALTFTIVPQFPVSSFDGKKSLVISTISMIGGKNPFLGYAYIIVGSICLGLALIFGIKQMFGGRRPGDTSFLGWPNAR